MSSTRCLFSPSGDLLGVCRPEGILQVYDAKVGVVRTNVAPSKNLAAACTCLAWKTAPPSRGKSPKKKSRKRKSSLSVAAGQPETEEEEGATETELAVGTGAGSVVIYSFQTGETKERSGVHDDVVNDLTWSHDGAALYSASADGHVGVCVVRKNSVSKFRPSSSSTKKSGGGRPRPLTSLALVPAQAASNSLLVGAEAQVLWLDLQSRSTLRAFDGHAGAVAVIKAFCMDSSRAFFLSAGTSEKDRMVNVWKLEKEQEGSDPQPEALLNVSEAVGSVAVNLREEDKVANIACVSRAGVVRLFDFDHKASRRKSKAVRPSATVQVSSSVRDKGDRVALIPIQAAELSSGSLRLAHGGAGGLSRLAFDTVSTDGMDKNTVLVREVEQAATQEQDYGIKFMNPGKSGATILAPGTTMTPKLMQSGQKRKSETGVGKVDQLPMVDRLRLLSKDLEGAAVTTPPRTDSLLQLLLQGLHNRDQKILSSVLDRADEELIDKTVRKLPVEGVIPLIEELQTYIRGRGMVNLSHSKWLRSVLQHHSAYLMSIPECAELLGPVLAMLEARTKSYGALMQLKGKLDIMTKQIANAADARGSERGQGEGEAADKEALLVYQDDSSDELSDVLDDLLLPASDNEEENWDVDEDREEADGDESEDEAGNSEEESMEEEDASPVMNGFAESDHQMDDSD